MGTTATGTKTSIEGPSRAVVRSAHIVGVHAGVTRVIDRAGVGTRSAELCSSRSDKAYTCTTASIATTLGSTTQSGGKSRYTLIPCVN